MKVVLIGTLALALVVGSVILLVSDPLIGFPGGRLAGPDGERPADWRSAAAVSTVQLETRPENPYSVNVWGVGIGSDFYVATRADGTTWSRNMDADPNVRLRLGESIYALSAARIDDADERERVLAAYVRKYEADPDDMAANAGLIYRLEDR
jgi:hypothetical protein